MEVGLGYADFGGQNLTLPFLAEREERIVIFLEGRGQYLGERVKGQTKSAVMSE